MTTELDQLRRQIKRCFTCGEVNTKVNKRTGEITETPVVKIPKGATPLVDSSNSPVPGSGSVGATYMFIGEAPGENEDLDGEPFTGYSGKYLKYRLLKILAKIQTDECYFTNIIKCHPLKNRDPYKAEIKACRKWLDKEIELVNPKYIFTVGRYATESILGMSLSESHGQVFMWHSKFVMPMYHPAGADRAIPKSIIEKDFKNIKQAFEAAIIEHPEWDLKPPDSTNYTLVKTANDLMGMFSLLDGAVLRGQPFSFDIETVESEYSMITKGPDPLSNKLGGFTISFHFEGELYSWYVPLCDHVDRLVTFKDLGFEDWEQARRRVLSELQGHFNNATRIYIHNLKFEMKSLRKYGFHIDYKKAFCTYLGAYILREESLGLKDIVRRNFAVTMTELGDLMDFKSQTIESIPLAEFGFYGNADSQYGFLWGELIDERLKDIPGNQQWLDFAHKLLPWIVDQELEGIEIDQDKHQELTKYFQKRLDETEKEIYEATGIEFNINSGDQVADVLFDKLKISPPTKPNRKTGVDEVILTESGNRISTAKDVLRPINYRHPAISKITEHNSLVTIKSTFLDGILGKLHPYDWRLHANINQALTNTSRFSMDNPNWQNIPVRTAESKRIREYIIPDEVGWWIFAPDQSQIELRYAAHLSQDEFMLEVLRDLTRSLHAETCRQIYQITPDDKDWDYNYKNSKNGNFCRLYRGGPFKLAETLECPLSVAQHFYDMHKKLMPGWDEYCAKQIERCKKTGYTETLFGFRRYIPEIQASAMGMRSRGERLAINVPVQGSSANHIQIAMGNIYEEMQSDPDVYNGRMMFQVHDEIVGCAPGEELVQTVRLIADKLENTVELTVPTPVDIEVGRNWGQLMKLDKWIELYADEYAVIDA